jgi:hypothetical protein
MVRYMEFDIVGIVLRKGAARRLKEDVVELATWVRVVGYL